jgi:putative transposase
MGCTHFPFTRALGSAILACVSKEDRSFFHVGRLTPSRGVHLTSYQPVIVWLTVCTKDRGTWLACPEVMTALESVWHDDALAWLMGDFLLMPDHLHGFCAPRDTRVEIEHWIAYWKSKSTRLIARKLARWQRGAFHHRLRSQEEFHEKWLYMMENPVRKGYVTRWEEWSWRGTVHDLRW